METAASNSIPLRGRPTEGIEGAGAAGRGEFLGPRLRCPASSRPKRHQFDVVQAGPLTAPRVASVDALRGFTMFWIIGADGAAKSLAEMQNIVKPRRASTEATRGAVS